MRSPAFLLAILALAGCVTPTPPTYDDGTADVAEPAPPSSPYVGQETREIKALSPDEVAGYEAGAGLGYAKPAELNSYPGPLHALEMADALQLTPEQRAQIQAVREDMLALAVPLGQRYLAIEAEIEQRFRDDAMDPATLERLLEESADIEAQIRYAHLEAHLDTKALMTRHQVVLYDQMRGYGGEGGEADHGAHGHDA